MVGTTTVRIPRKTHEQLRKLAAELGQPMTDVIAAALEEYRRELFFRQVEEDYRALQADPVAWREYLEDHEELDGSLMDDLEDEESEWLTDQSTAATSG